MDDENPSLPVRGESDEDEVVFRERILDHDISWLKKFGYGVGHFYNDLCASMWFTYLMIYFEKVLKFRSSMAGMLMLIGQVTDAICTPIVGIASDSNILPRCFDKIGRRISWHIIGTICVTISFPFIFNQCFICHDGTTEMFRVFWFVPFIMLFQFGWASVQISHLALIPELSSIDASRTTMNSLRYAFTVLANLAVFFVLAFFLSQESAAEHQDIGPHDLKYFRDAGYIVVGGGLLVTFLFYITTREPVHGRRFSRLNSISSDASELMRMHWTSWFGHIQFYQIALLYMLSRLYVNISQVYFPFYITLTQNLPKHYVAILPMVSYFSSFAISTLTGIPFINERLNKKILYVIGIISGLVNCVFMSFPLIGWEMYGISVLIGLTQAILLINSLSITADLINKNTESGAFVYGAMSFVDKLANGIAYQLIELWNPSCDATKSHDACSTFYRDVMVYVPGVCLLLALLTLLSLVPVMIGERRRGTVVDSEREPIVSNEEPVAEIVP